MCIERACVPTGHESQSLPLSGVNYMKSAVLDGRAHLGEQKIVQKGTADC